jgi:hypothetical protein
MAMHGIGTLAQQSIAQRIRLYRPNIMGCAFSKFLNAIAAADCRFGISDGKI